MKKKSTRFFTVLLVLGILFLGMPQVQVFGASKQEPSQAAKKLVIGFSMPALTHSFWIPMLYGVRDQAKKYNMEVVDLNAGGFGNLDTQISQMENLIHRGVDIIIMGATSAEGVVPVVEEAQRAKIPVIGVGSQPKTDILTKVVADDYGMGVMQAQYMGKYLQGKGEVALMSGPPGLNWSVDRAKGFRDTLAKSYPGAKIVAEQWTEVSRPKAIELMESWLQAFPSLRGVYTANDDLAAGAVRAIISAGKTNQIKVSSCNPTEIGIEYMKAGYILCEAVQQTVMQGRAAVDAAYAKLNGKTPQKVIVTPALLLTRENLATFDFSTVTHPESFKP